MTTAQFMLYLKQADDYKQAALFFRNQKHESKATRYEILQREAQEKAEEAWWE